ncbi:MAG: hypothetical protein MUF42_15850 [Cytophagaceae bacterium]|jgi:hypothetical protein|nr:hypothetical protein [Cytophagaceae bacterium]
MKINKLWWIFLLIIFETLNSNAQDLAQLGKKDAIKVNGSLSFMNMLYAQNGLPQNRRDPYAWLLSGSIGINVAGWSAPFTFTLSSQSRSFNQPFNNYGLSPKYKNLTLHAGYRNMTFGSYTLNGHTFLGGGVEYTPPHWKIAAMYGRMLRAVEEDTLNASVTGSPAFERWGHGARVGYEDNGHGLDISYFKGRDVLNSISYVPVKSEVRPGENLSLGISGKTKFKKLILQAEYGTSAYTSDLRSEETETNSIFSKLNGLFTYRGTTAVYHAMKGSVSYSIRKVNLGASYERIDPGYQSMGSYFMNGDLENVTFNTATRIIKDKANLAFNIGTQRDNIKETKAMTTRRLIGSVNLSYNPSQKWNFAGTYSNFQTSANTAQRIQQFQNNDTLRFLQVNQNANVTIGYNGGSKEKKNGVTLNIGWQVADNNQRENSSTRMLNGNLTYRRTLTAKSLTLGAGVNANQSDLGGRISNAIGPIVTASSAFWKKKIKSSLTSTVNHVETSGAPNSTVWNINMNHNMVLAKRHSFVMTLSMINYLTATASYGKYQEYMATVGYSVGF